MLFPPSEKCFSQCLALSPNWSVRFFWVHRFKKVIWKEKAEKKSFCLLLSFKRLGPQSNTQNPLSEKMFERRTSKIRAELLFTYLLLLLGSFSELRQQKSWRKIIRVQTLVGPGKGACACPQVAMILHPDWDQASASSRDCPVPNMASELENGSFAPNENSTENHWMEGPCV